jgi:perosamine synthetase
MSIFPSTIISASLSPNTESDDVLAALRVFFSPWMWKKGNAVSKTEAWFEKRYPGSVAVSLNSGRSALLAILTSFGIGEGDEVLVQSFSCVAVANSVLWANASPIFVDVDDSLNIDPLDLPKKISKHTKAIIVQHTFGVPAAMDQIMVFAHKHNLLVIEDCAHALGATYRGKPVGSYGDAAFFSFGRDKVVSSVFGGMAIINNVKHQVSSDKLREYQKQLSFPSYFWIKQQLLHPIAFAIILPLYNVGIGKALLIILQKLRLLSFPVYKEEKQGIRPTDFPKQYPNALAILLVKQLAKLEKFNETRRSIAKFYCSVTRSTYQKEAVYLRFPIFVDNPEQLMKNAKQKNMLLGNWYHNTIDPSGVDFRAIGYRVGSCPNAERLAKRVVNLPTRINLTQAKKVASLL